MSIDARVHAVHYEIDWTMASGCATRLVLIDRPGGGPAGQEALTCDGFDPNANWLIGRDIWGGAGEIQLGDKTIAKRKGYTMIEFVDLWEQWL